ncbi:MAG: hypothetical protein HC927_03650 [Deltaproteobacteria bacterium]|nr:hypothetical protein [Deltaproteobacteria bacterium]
MTARIPEPVLSQRLCPVAFELWLPSGPEIEWTVVSLRGKEAISTPYEFELELSCADEGVPWQELLGADCELLLDRNGMARSIYGIIEQVEVVAAADARSLPGELRLRLRVVPALKLLEQQVDTRFFEGLSVIEILREVLGRELGAYRRRVDVESRILGNYPARDYCVQFRESTLAFCSRIMEEEGIAYVFVPDPDSRCETLVLVDANARYEEAELLVPEIVGERHARVAAEARRVLAKYEELRDIIASHLVRPDLRSEELCADEPGLEVCLRRCRGGTVSGYCAKTVDLDLVLGESDNVPFERGQAAGNGWVHSIDVLLEYPYQRS